MMAEIEKAVGAAVRKIEAGQSKLNAEQIAKMQDVLTELSTAMTDIVAALEGTSNADKIIAGFERAVKSLRVQPTVNVAAPNVTVQAPNVSVSAPSVNVAPPAVHNHVTVPEVAVHMVKEPPPKCAIRHEVDFKLGAGGIPTGMTITPIYKD